MSQLVTVSFHEDTLFALEHEGGVSVAVTPICNRLGLDAKKQRERIQRDPILSQGGAMMALPSPGGTQETFVLRLDLVNGWLFTIDESRVKPEARPLVLAYKGECYAVLFRHFYGRHAERIEPPPIAAREEPVRIRRQLVTEARHVFGERAAGRLWFALGLPIVPEMQEPQPQSSFGFTYTALPDPAPPQPPGSGPA